MQGKNEVSCQGNISWRTRVNWLMKKVYMILKHNIYQIMVVPDSVWGKNVC